MGPITRLLAAIVLFAVAAVPAQGEPGPKLRAVDLDPVRLAGSGFSPGESVRVRVRVAGHTRTKRARAGDRGRFRVRFRELAQPRCGPALTARAVGSDGHRATLKLPPRGCPPETEPPPGAAHDPPEPSPAPPDRCTTGERLCPPAL
jgi:hypothetical protein